MRWEGRRESQNVEDRRGMRFGQAGGIGLGTIVLALVAAYFGVDPVRRAARTSAVAAAGGAGAVPGIGRRGAAARVRLGRARRHRGRLGRDLRRSRHALTSSPSWCCSPAPCESACGFAQAAVGPFYCPGDRQVYIDLSFYQELQTLRRARRLRAGVRRRARSRASRADAARHLRAQHGARQRASEAEANALSVRQELQADCFAGIWAHNADRSRAVARSGRHRRRSQRRRRHRRRSSAAAVARLRLAGVVHARQLGAARALVQARLRIAAASSQCDTFGTSNL